jgi:hypothetical protein
LATIRRRTECEAAIERRDQGGAIKINVPDAKLSDSAIYSVLEVPADCERWQSSVEP